MMLQEPSVCSRGPPGWYTVRCGTRVRYPNIEPVTCRLRQKCEGPQGLPQVPETLLVARWAMAG